MQIKCTHAPLTYISVALPQCIHWTLQPMWNRLSWCQVALKRCSLFTRDGSVSRNTLHPRGVWIKIEIETYVTTSLSLARALFIPTPSLLHYSYLLEWKSSNSSRFRHFFLLRNHFIEQREQYSLELIAFLSAILPPYRSPNPYIHLCTPPSAPTPTMCEPT